MSDFTLTIYGATGYTGRLCVAEAVRQQIPVRLAGRRADALERLAEEHAGAGVPVSTTVADVTDGAAVRALAESSDVLLSTVGPYEQFGRPVVEAALDTVTPYLDVTGELDFITWVRAQSSRAEERGVTLAPAVGFDGVPGDLLAALAAEALPGSVKTARVAYSMESVRASAGTARSALGMLNRGGNVWRNGRVCQEPAGVEQWHVPFPDPPGPATAVSVPFPEVASVGPSVGADLVRAYVVVPAGWLVPSVAGPAQRFASLLSTTPVWAMLERAVDRLPDGPSDESRQRAKSLVLAEVTNGAGVSSTRWARITDVYGSTAVIAVAGALRLAQGDVAAGVLTPSQLFDPAALLSAIADELGPA